MNDVNLLAGAGTALGKDNFFVVFGHRDDEISGVHFSLQLVPVRLNIRTSSRETEWNSSQAMNNQPGYGRMVRKVRVDVLDPLLLHFVSKSNRFREERKSPAKTAKASPGSSQYFG